MCVLQKHFRFVSANLKGLQQHVVTSRQLFRKARIRYRDDIVSLRFCHFFGIVKQRSLDAVADSRKQNSRFSHLYPLRSNDLIPDTQPRFEQDGADRKTWAARRPVRLVI